jgi:hypothetical protein
MPCNDASLTPTPTPTVALALALALALTTSGAKSVRVASLSLSPDVLGALAQGPFFAILCECILMGWGIDGPLGRYRRILGFRASGTSWMDGIA